MRKAQSGTNAGILIILITVALILYILFLPPDVRDDLLNDGSSYEDNDDDSGSKLLLSTVPGRIDYVSTRDRTHTIPNFRILVDSEPSVVTSSNSIKVVNSAFTKSAKTLSFDADPDSSSNMLLSFNVNDGDGELIIELNGDEIFHKEVSKGNSEIIPLNINQYSNELRFFVSSPGFLFFLRNEYSLSNIKVSGDLKDLTRSESRQTFGISEEEYNNMERAQLKYFSDCNARTVGKMNIFLNGETIFKGIPDCGITSKHDFDITLLDEGSNELVFMSDEGSYIIDAVEVRTYSSERGNPSFYFDLDEEYFDDNGDFKDDDYDVILEFKFTDDDDSKRLEVDVNQNTFSFRTRDDEYDRNIEDWVEQGTNRIELIAESKVDIARLKVFLED